MSKSKGKHILYASTNLLGFSFIAVTTLRALRLIHTTHVDQFAAFGVVVFTVSVILSFLSIRSTNDKHSKSLENFAEYIFLLGLFTMLCLVVLIEVRLV